jgi:hypothetical protein
MKRLFFAVAILGALAFGSGPVLNGSHVQAATGERAVVEFRDTVRLVNVFLRGRYVVVHDDSSMARGEPCLRVFSIKDPDNLIVAFHCTPIERGKAEHFIVRTSRSSALDVPSVLEIQFAGSNTGHRVP